jgi:hypothetical protein
MKLVIFFKNAVWGVVGTVGIKKGA